jgi:hypothetical protein
MPPRAEHEPMWTWEMCDDMGVSPVILSSTVKDPEPFVRVIVPLADVPIPFSAKIRGTAEGVEAGVDAAGLGDGDGEEPVSVEPQAAPIRARAANTTNRLNPAFSVHNCPRSLPLKVT